MSEVTIILFSYNRPELVKEAVNSVLQQTFIDFELMVIENSTDNLTRPVLESYKDTRIKLFYENPTDEERADCLVLKLFNKYVKLITSKYFCMTNDDDVLLPTCLEESYKFAEKTGHEACYFGQYWLTFDENSSLVVYECDEVRNALSSVGSNGVWKVHPFGNRTPTTVYDRQHSPVCAIGGHFLFVRTSCLKDIEEPYMPIIPEKYAICDGLFIQKLANRFGVYPIGKTLAISRFHSGQGITLRR